MTPPKTKPYADCGQRIRAVYSRDQQAHNAFIYAVKTTGIYCRPTCPSRRPKQENILIFDASSDAENAGFRPCKRCAPHIHTVSTVDGRIVSACRVIERSDQNPPLAQLAQSVGLSPFHFHRLFKQTLGVTPKQYADALRTERLQGGLQKGQPVSEALYAAGFGSSSRVYEKADQLLGMTPGQYGDRGSRASIKYALTRTSLGWLLVAATEKGVCFIALGDSPYELTQSLEQRFSKADIIKADDDLAEALARITVFLDSPDKGLDLPLDIRGTSFQRRLWSALQELKPGQTVTYSQMAQRLGMPQAPRAVARAIASNPIALAVPCHRVVRKDGGLGGYRWGIQRKERLLELESGEGD
jgi:AraC family transcriptional regulator of adaptative response/methylated-DNA-[protein]-cysteine methyltransferase